MQRPDYRNGSIVNLMASVRTALGSPSAVYSPLPSLPSERLRQARNLVLLVIDGLGHNWLRRHGKGSFLQRHLAGRITSVFPSTTASAVTTFLTGEAPQQHGITGWFMYFREIGAVTRVLPYQPRFGRSCLASEGIEPGRLLGHGSLFDRLEIPAWIVSPRHIARTPYNLAHRGRARLADYEGLDELFSRLLDIVSAGRERRYVYAYWPDLDSLAHERGVESGDCEALFRRLDTALAGLCAKLAGTDTLLLVTADHGLVDTSPERCVDLADHPGLAECLLLPLCGEPRAAYCYLHPHRVEQFETYVSERLHHCAQLHKSADLLAEGMFGLGDPHPRLRERIGHYTLIMRGNYVIRDRVLGEKAHPLVGVHGGLSENEMVVPLIIYRA